MHGQEREKQVTAEYTMVRPREERADLGPTRQGTLKVTPHKLETARKTKKRACHAAELTQKQCEHNQFNDLSAFELVARALTAVVGHVQPVLQK